MSTPIQLREVADRLRELDNFAIIAHIRPDGDALGSTIALGAMLEALGKTVTMYNEDAVPAGLRFLQGTERIQRITGERVVAQVGIALDNGSWKRIGDRAIESMRDVPLWFNIDHHGTNECYGDFCCVMPEECSTGAIIYKLGQMLGTEFSEEISNALYVAISTDTGSFQYEKTTPEVMEMVAELIRLGVNVHEINKQLYQEIPWESLLLTRELLNNIQFSSTKHLAYYSLTQKTKKKLNVGEADSEGLIDVLRSIKGTILAAIFEEMEDGRIRISLRSKDQLYPVDQIATQFGGGGHALAAGIRMRCPIEEAVQLITQALELSHAEYRS